MAERQVTGKNVLLFLDPAGGTSYKLIVCLTENSYERTKTVVEATTKCGTNTLPGTISRTVNFSGQVVVDPDTGRISEADLDDYFEDDTVVGWKMGPAVPVADDVTYSGVGYISDLSATYGTNDAATFSASLKVNGTPTKTITVP